MMNSFGMVASSMGLRNVNKPLSAVILSQTHVGFISQTQNLQKYYIMFTPKMQLHDQNKLSQETLMDAVCTIKTTTCNDVHYLVLCINSLSIPMMTRTDATKPADFDCWSPGTHPATKVTQTSLKQNMFHVNFSLV